MHYVATIKTVLSNRQEHLCIYTQFLVYTMQKILILDGGKIVVNYTFEFIGAWKQKFEFKIHVLHVCIN